VALAVSILVPPVPAVLEPVLERELMGMSPAVVVHSDNPGVIVDCARGFETVVLSFDFQEREGFHSLVR